MLVFPLFVPTKIISSNEINLAEARLNSAMIFPEEFARKYNKLRTSFFLFSSCFYFSPHEVRKSSSLNAASRKPFGDAKMRFEKSTALMRGTWREAQSLGLIEDIKAIKAKCSSHARKERNQDKAQQWHKKEREPRQSVADIQEGKKRRQSVAVLQDAWYYSQCLTWRKIHAARKSRGKFTLFKWNGSQIQSSFIIY